MTIPVVRGQAVRILTEINRLPNKLPTCRSIHLHQRPMTQSMLTRGRSIHRTEDLLGSIFVKFNSTVAADSLPSIPEPPSPIINTTETITQFGVIGEPSFASVGLGGWSPTGLLENMFEHVHLAADLPWWSTIVTGAILVRLGTSWFFIKGQRLNAKQQEHQPVLSKFQKELSEAQAAGQMSEASLTMQKQYLYMKKHGISIARVVLYALVQGAVNLTAFLAVRNIHNSSLESLRTGGIYWFTDLTVPDPYYILPIATCALIGVLTEMVSANNAGLQTPSAYSIFIRLSPIICLPLMIMFPSGQQLYWIAANTGTIALYSILRVPRIRRALDIPDVKKKEKGVAPILNQLTEFKQKMVESGRLKKARGYDDSFERAGRGPIPTTFAENPLKTSNQRIKKRMTG